MSAHAEDRQISGPFIKDPLCAADQQIKRPTAVRVKMFLV